VQVHWGAAGAAQGKQVLEEDKATACHLFKGMFDEPAASILIGSQRVNYLLECVVADLFGVEPFRPAPQRGEPKIPFYLLYHPDRRMIEGCFGGTKRVPGWRGRLEPGTYWRNERDEWECLPWRKREQDAGIAVVVYYPGTKVLHTALFGYSGRGTALLAKKLCADSYQFWPPGARGSGKEVGVYVCKFITKKPPPPSRDALAELSNNDCEIVPLSQKTLEKYLK
jgi:hypothetical protein